MLLFFVCLIFYAEQVDVLLFTYYFLLIAKRKNEEMVARINGFCQKLEQSLRLLTPHFSTNFRIFSNFFKLQTL